MRIHRRTWKLKLWRKTRLIWYLKIEVQELKGGQKSLKKRMLKEIQNSHYLVHRMSNSLQRSLFSFTLFHISIIMTNDHKQ